jgi:carboxymethylenebutenolidase
MTESMAETTVEQVPTHDGGSMPARLVIPEAADGAAVVVIHEIFGVNDYMQAVLDRLAGLGYIALCGDLFWRIDPGHDIPQDEAGLGQAMERMGSFDFAEATRDCDAALGYLSRRPEVTGPVAVLGFCLGGTLAYATAISSEPDAVVAYYGSGIAGLLDQAGAIDCPMLFHFGTDDAFIPADDVDRIEASFADRDDIEICRYAAGHAFDNSFSDLFHDPAAAEEAWGVTTDFLRRVLVR